MLDNEQQGIKRLWVKYPQQPHPQSETTFDSQVRSEEMSQESSTTNDAMLYE